MLVYCQKLIQQTDIVKPALVTTSIVKPALVTTSSQTCFSDHLYYVSQTCFSDHLY